ncbi:MAG TPA: 16S rRNA (adenine(1518)-N(6)/adenine(1519)-N(6))-dimethyltransferase RsmA [Candidatus Saccharimonadales bacterium]|nr:16S rRNA (adenine(1518)-N(6)/adenine(1519)-N(6))-dimethyltransferase RsmA [Candidatus Saccharimonadales bacterium]
MEDQPKKSLGQHWLRDEPTLTAIVDAASISGSDIVVEVGPGPGYLTRHLADQAKKVIAIELDDNLAAKLPGRVKAGNLEIIHEDILRLDLSTLPTNYKVVANIPYYLTSNLLRTLSESTNPPKFMVLLVQKEVAERICARPGQMSLLSVSVQLYYGASLGVVVPADKFDPPPKVDSQVVILKRHWQPMFPKLDERKFFQVVKAGFAGRRKKLRSSLAAGLHMSKEQVDELLLRAEVNGDLRAQNLSLNQWYEIYLAVTAKQDLRALI